MLKINLVEFQNAIERISKVVPKKHALPMLELVNLVGRSGSQDLTLYVTDLIYSCMITINAKIDYNFDINVKIDDIKKGIKYFKNEITLSMESNSKIKLTDGSKSMLIDYVDDDLQDKIFQGLRIDYIVKNEYVTDLQTLMTRLDKVSMSFAKDGIRPILNAAHFNKNDIVTCDGYRVSLNRSDDLYIVNPLNVPFDNLLIMKKLISKRDKGNITIYDATTHTSFSFGNTTFKIKNIEGDYVNYRSFFDNSDRSDYFNVDYTELKDSVKYLYNMSSNKKLPIVLETKEESLHIVFEELGNRYETKNALKNKIKDIRIAFNPEFILDAINCLDQDNLIFSLSNDKTSINPMILSTKNQNEKYLVLPVRCEK